MIPDEQMQAVLGGGGKKAIKMVDSKRTPK
jgi:hypothetical protein